MQERFFKKNEVIFWEGSMGSCLYKIIEGTVSVVLGYGSKEEQKLTELGPGRIFGEMRMTRSGFWKSLRRNWTVFLNLTPTRSE